MIEALREFAYKLGLYNPGPELPDAIIAYEAREPVCDPHASDAYDGACYSPRRVERFYLKKPLHLGGTGLRAEPYEHNGQKGYRVVDDLK